MVDSSISWLDFSDAERRKMIEIVALFKERDTRDELGIASIRDSFADLFFPGTTTLQTRARYFLFVPWLYKYYESKQVPSAKINDRLKNDECVIRNELIRAGETSGIIGMRAGDSLQRFPSSIYWIGLQTWGVNRFMGTQDQYHRSLNHWYQRQSLRIDTDEHDPSEGFSGNWDGKLPPAPKGFPYSANFSLKRAEAEFLRDRLAISCANSLLAYLVESTEPLDPQSTFAWFHPDYDNFPTHLKIWLNHARNFSELMHGAMLLYNLKLALLIQNDQWVSTYRQRLKKWNDMIISRQEIWKTWDRSEFWHLVSRKGINIPYFTHRFVDEWIDQIFKDGLTDQPENKNELGSMIEKRESYLKGPRSRFTSRQHLEMWSGSSLAGQFDFRWGIASRIIHDIHDGLRQWN